MSDKEQRNSARRSYEYSNGVSLSEPWRYTEFPVWGKDGGGWDRFIPAKIRWRGMEDAYYVGESNE